MVKSTLDILIYEKDQPKKVKKYRIKSSDNEDIVIEKSLNGGPRQLVTEIPFEVTGPTPPPDVDLPPIVDAGHDITIQEGEKVIIDGSAHDDGEIVRTEWLFDESIKDFVKVVPEDNTNIEFTAPELLDTETARGYIFKLEVEDNKSNISTDTVIVTVTQSGEAPPPPPPPEPSTAIYDSNRDIDWSKPKRTVKVSEGNIGPNGKGFYTAASGSPVADIDPADKSITLRCGDGHGRLYFAACHFDAVLETDFTILDETVDNNSEKTDSRHQMGGACEHRFGGLGCAFSSTECDIKIEQCHNIHEKGVTSKLPQSIKIGQKVRSKFMVTHNGGKIQQIAYLDYLDGNGYQKIDETEFSNPKPFYMDKDLILKQSEFWLRLNGSGRIKYQNILLTAI